MATLYSPKIVTDGLKLTFDIGNRKSYTESGTTLIDLVSNINGTLINGPVYSTVNNGIITFDGNNDYLSLPGNITTTILGWTPLGSIGTSTMTIEMWFKTTDTAGDLYSKPWNGGGGYNIRFGTSYLTIGPLHVDYQTTNNINFLQSLNDGVYHQLVCWMNSTQFGYYIDGGRLRDSKNHGFVSDNPSGTAPNANVNGAIMTLYPYGEGWAGNTGYSIAADLAIFKIYHKILSATEVLQNFNATRSRFGI